jgi:hypothetical protein
MSSFFIPLAYRSPGEIPLKLLQGPALVSGTFTAGAMSFHPAAGMY